MLSLPPYKVPLVIMTSPATEWVLPGFFRQLETHGAADHSSVYDWCVPYVFGFDQTNQALLADKIFNHRFVTLGDFADYPNYKWSDAFILALKILSDADIKSFWFMLDDYWIVRGVDARGVIDLYEYHKTLTDDVIKIDLAYDRLYADSGYYDLGQNTLTSVGHMDVIQARPECQYYMSLWGGLFSTSAMLKFLQPGWTAQEVELSGTSLLRQMHHLVLGTRQGPVIHTNVCHGGKVFNFGGPQLSGDDMRMLRKNKMTRGY